MNRFLSRNKYILTFLVSIFIIGLIFGIYLFNKDNNILIDNIKDQLFNNHVSMFFNHLIIILIIILLSFTIIGYLCGVFYLFYEGVSISYTIYYLTYNMGFKGLLFGFLYNIIFKFIFIILLFILLIKLFNFSKYIISLLFIKDKYIIYPYIKNNLIKIIIIYIIILFIDIILYYISKFIISVLLLII